MQSIIIKKGEQTNITAIKQTTPEHEEKLTERIDVLVLGEPSARSFVPRQRRCAFIRLRYNSSIA
jgi:hypothetical protein